jgi:ubiquinone biosynthesis O-methyltransferase
MFTRRLLTRCKRNFSTPPSVPSSLITPTPAASATTPPPISLSSIDVNEVTKFNALGGDWWSDEIRGPFSALHAMNGVRVPLLRRALAPLAKEKAAAARREKKAAVVAAAAAAADGKYRDAAADSILTSLPLSGLRILDVGCGGGIFSLALARLGAHVLGLDASQAGIAAATARAAMDPVLSQRTEFRVGTLEELVTHTQYSEAFDGVVASEVLEHVSNPASFLFNAGTLVAPRGGVLFISTINRTPASFAAAIGVAEYVLRLAPAGTHEWTKFIRPQEVEDAIHDAGLNVDLKRGFFYNPFTGQWALCPSLAVNYAIIARKK